MHTLIRLRLTLVALLFVGSLLARPCAAADDTRAVALFHEGRDAIVNNQFEKAYAALSEAWQLKQSYDIAALLGQTELKLEKWAAAAEHLSFSVQTFPSAGDQRKKKKAVEALFEQAKLHVAELTVTVSEDGAEVLLDGASIGRAPLGRAVFVDAGEHELVARARGFRDATEVLTATAGSEQAVTLTLKAESASAGPPVGAGSAGPAGASSHTGGRGSNPGEDHAAAEGGAPTWVLVTGGALAAVGLGVGIGYALRAGSADQDASDALAKAEGKFGNNPCAANPSDPLCVSVQDSLDRRGSSRTVATVGFVGAGVFGAGTVAAYFLWPKGEAKSALTVAPALGRASSGLIMRGEF